MSDFRKILPTYEMDDPLKKRRRILGLVLRHDLTIQGVLQESISNH